MEILGSFLSNANIEYQSETWLYRLFMEILGSFLSNANIEY